MSAISAYFASKLQSALDGRLGVVRDFAIVHYALLRFLIAVLITATDLIYGLYRFPVFTAGLLVLEMLVCVYMLLRRNPIVVFTEACCSIWTTALMMVGFRGVAAAEADRIKEMEELIDRLLQENQKLHMENADLLVKVNQVQETLVAFQESFKVPVPDISKVSIGLIVIILLAVVYLAVRKLARDIRARVALDEEYLPLRDLGLSINRESYRAGSEEVEMDPPKSLLQISSIDSIPLGHGIVVKNPSKPTEPLLLTATHVVADKSKVFISRHEGTTMVLDLGAKCYNLGTDVSMIPLTQTHLTVLGISKRDLASLARQSVTLENVMAFCPPKATMGAARPAKEFGLVTYSGTTRPGYSGTPYMVGKTVHAIHTGSTSLANVGVDAALITARIIRAYSPAEKDEDTSDWLFDEVTKIIGKGKAPEWKHYGADIYEVKINGRYYQAYEDDMREMGIFPSEESYPAYNDSDSGNGPQGSALVQGPGRSEQSNAAQSPSASISSPTMSLPLPTESILSSIAHLQSTVAQLVSASPPTVASSKGKRKLSKTARAATRGSQATKPSTPPTVAASQPSTSSAQS